MAVMDAQENMENGPATLAELVPPKSGDWVGVGTGPIAGRGGVAVGESSPGAAGS